MKLNDIVKAVPLLTALFIFSGIIKNVFYYNLFGVHIINYLTIQESLKLFLEDLFLFTVAVLTFLFNSLQVSADHVSIFFKRKDSQRERVSKEKEHLKNFRGYLSTIRYAQKKKKPMEKTLSTLKWKRIVNRKIDKIFWPIIVALVIIIAIILFLSLVAFLATFSTVIISAFVSLLFVVIFSQKITLYNVYKTILPDAKPIELKMLNSLIVIFIALNIFSITEAYDRYYKLITYKECRTASIITKADTIRPYSNEYYIGETESHVFTFNDSYQTKLINRSDVLVMSFQKSKDSTSYKKALDWVNEFVGIKKKVIEKQ